MRDGQQRQFDGIRRIFAFCGGKAGPTATELRETRPASGSDRKSLAGVRQNNARNQLTCNRRGQLGKSAIVFHSDDIL